jgi:hypothetical protein
MTPSAPVRRSAPPVRQRTRSECASAPIGGALHSLPHISKPRPVRHGALNQLGTTPDHGDTMTTTIRSPEPTGQQLLDLGLSNVLAADLAVHRGHQFLVEQALDVLIRRNQPFTADDVRHLLGPAFRPATLNLVGAVFAGYHRAGRIHPVGWCGSARPVRHHGAQRIWVAAAVGEAA